MTLPPSPWSAAEVSCQRVYRYACGGDSGLTSKDIAPGVQLVDVHHEIAVAAAALGRGPHSVPVIAGIAPVAVLVDMNCARGGVSQAQRGAQRRPGVQRRRWPKHGRERR